MICWPAAERYGAMVVHRLRVAASAERGHSLQLLKFYGPFSPGPRIADPRLYKRVIKQKLNIEC